MFITSGIEARARSAYAANENDDDDISTSGSIHLHEDMLERAAIKADGQLSPIAPLPTQVLPRIANLKPTAVKEPEGPWQKIPVVELSSLADVRAVYAEAIAHSPRQARKVMAAVLTNAARLGLAAQEPESSFSANKALNVAALLLREHLLALCAKHKDRFDEDIKKLFFNLPHPQKLASCGTVQGCEYQGILAGCVIAGIAKIEPTRSFDADTLGRVIESFAVHLNGTLGHQRKKLRHVAVLWPAGHSLASAIFNKSNDTRGNVYRFVATLEDFMLSSDALDPRAFNKQMVKTLWHCMV